MRPRVRLLLAPGILVYGFAAAYTLIACWPFVLVWLSGMPDAFDQDMIKGLRVINVVVLIAWGVVYGLYRSIAFHPVWRAPYRNWLAVSPWRPGLPLPLGPVHLVWQDALFMAVLVALAVIVSHAHPAIPLIAVLGGYLLGMTANLIRTRQPRSVLVILAIIPLTWYVWDRPWLILLVTAVGWLIGTWGLQRSWRSLPWGLLDDPSRAKPDSASLGWPFDRLNAHEPRAPIRTRSVMIGALLVGWYVFSFFHCYDEPGWRKAETITMGIVMFGFVVAFVRALVYCGGRHAPLPLRARIRLGRLLLPGYDRALVAPLLTATTAIAGPVVLGAFKLYDPLTGGIMTAVLLMMGFGLPPTLRKWQLTGHFRISIPAG